MKMMNMKVIMMASLQMMQVNVPTMLMSIRISAMVDGVIRLFMSFCCRLVFKDSETDLTYANFFFRNVLNLWVKNSSSPVNTGDDAQKKNFENNL